MSAGVFIVMVMYTPNEEILQSRAAISRRKALGLGGSVGLAGLIAACTGNTATPTSERSTTAAATTSTAAGDTETQLKALLDKAPGCVTSPEETQGPYYFDVDSIRSDITEDRPGLPLELMIRVQNTNGCVVGSSDNPVANAAVEIWHCDAGGVYSGFEVASLGSNSGPGGPSGDQPAPPGSADSDQPAPPPGADDSNRLSPPDQGGQPGPNGQGAGSGSVSDGSYSVGEQEAEPTDDSTYLRGAQMTNAEGIVRFSTIYPGWYPSRTVHIHVKVHINRDTVLTTQLFFDDTLSDKINSTVSPYNEHTGRDTKNDTDSIYEPEGLLQATYDGNQVLAAINIGIEQ